MRQLVETITRLEVLVDQAWKEAWPLWKFDFWYFRRSLSIWSPSLELWETPHTHFPICILISNTFLRPLIHGSALSFWHSPSSCEPAMPSWKLIASWGLDRPNTLSDWNDEAVWRI